LRHRAFVGIDDEDAPVYHTQHPFDFAAEVGVSGGIDNVNQRIFVANCCIFRQDSNAPFPFEVVGVHHAVRNVLPFAEDAGLFEKRVHEGGFAVVDVGDDCDVADWERHKEASRRCAVTSTIDFFTILTDSLAIEMARC